MSDGTLLASDDVDHEQIGAADVDEVADTATEAEAGTETETDSGSDADDRSDDTTEADDVEPAVAVQDGETLPRLSGGQIATVQIATTEIVEVTFTAAPEQSAAVAEHDDGPVDLEALTRYGPGPLDALRFKWSVRQAGEDYYVDETIGTSSQPITSGPFSRAEAIAFIDGRDRRTRRRYERLRNEIVSGPSERGVEDDDDDR